MHSPLQLVSTTRAELDNGFLQTVFEQFEKVPFEVEEQEPLSFDYDPEWARSEEERLARKPIEAECADFKKDVEAGREKIQEKRATYVCKDLKSVLDALKRKSQELSIDLQNLEVAILEIANRIDPASETEKRLLQEAKLEREIDLKGLIALFFRGDGGLFIQANGYLAHPTYCEEMATLLGVAPNKNVVVTFLYNLIGLYLATATYKQRIERALKADDDRDMALELDPKCLAVYNIHDYSTFLAFEYRIGLAFRAQQATNLIEMIHSDHLVKQMLMGEGKSTMIAPTKAYENAKPGFLSIYIVPASLYATTVTNFRKVMKEVYNREIEEIDFPNDKILDMAEEIEKRALTTMNKGGVLVAKAEMILSIILKFRTLLLDRPNRAHFLPKINQLGRILYLFRRQTKALIDEVDLVLNILQESNTPIGEKRYAKVERIHLLCKLFLLFESEKARFGPKEEEVVDLKKLIGLQENRQSLLSDVDFKDVVAKAVAWKFAKESALLKLNHQEDFHLSFYRYISGKIKAVCQKLLDHSPDHANYSRWEGKLTEQDKKDLEFLRYVRTLRYSPDKDPEKIETAHQIALIKHMMMTIFPSTFKKKGNQDYGRGQRPGEVRPYRDVDTPSTDYYGCLNEWLAYHPPTALQCKILAPQLAEIANLFREGAESSLKAKNLVFDEKTKEMITPEALRFRELTNVDLELIDRPGKLEEAVEYVKNNVKSLLKLEAESAATQVSYHEARQSANGFSIVNIFLNVTSMSATPYNAHCFEDCLADSYKPEYGTEGQIAVETLRRVEQDIEDPHVHIVKSKKLEELVKTIFSGHPHPEEIELFMDTGSYLDSYKTIDIVKELRKWRKRPILFFDRNPHIKEMAPDTLSSTPSK